MNIARSLAAWTLPTAFLAAMLFRITIGVDLSDEAYYLTFLDDWLKDGVRNSELLAVHQTAQLLVYPAVKLYYSANGTEGLALFHRGLYLLFACGVGFCVFSFTKLYKPSLIAILAGMLVVSFVPFSLPAPSYNTLGMLSLIGALTARGIDEKHPARIWSIISAIFWTIAVIAYPPLLLPLAAALIFALKDRTYIVLVATFMAIGALALTFALGFGKIQSILDFSNASLQVSEHFGVKMYKALSLFRQSPILTTMCLACVVTGISMVLLKQGNRWLLLTLVGIFAFGLYSGPFLFAAGHDLVILLFMTGLGYYIASWSLGRAPSASRIFVVGAVAALTTTITATNGLVNFAIGGFTCAIALAIDLEEAEIEHGVFLGALVGLFTLTAFSFVYGESAALSVREAQRVESGVFRGLRTTPQTNEAIRQTAAYLQTTPGSSVAIIGRLPGIYLLTPMQSRTLSTWDFGQFAGTPPKLEKLIADFYALDRNRPSTVLVIDDEWTRQPSPADLRFISMYSKHSSLTTKNWSITAFTQ